MSMYIRHFHITCIAIISMFIPTAHAMHIYEFKPELIALDVVPTEYTAYKQLVECPLPYDITYVAIPWTWLINHKQLHTVPQTERFTQAFTICQHIGYEYILPYMRTLGIHVLFTPHVSCRKTYDGITVLPFPHYPVSTREPAAHKDLLYSFIGAPTHRTRATFFSMKHPQNTLVIKRNGWHFWTALSKKNEYTQNYIDALSRSRFAPCIRGTGASTIRFWEALGAGAIPILVSDEMKLPEFVDWHSCILRVAEHDVRKIPDIILSISPEQEESMRKNCLEAYTLFSGDQFTYTIRAYYDTLLGNV